MALMLTYLRARRFRGMSGNFGGINPFCSGRGVEEALKALHQRQGRAFYHRRSANGQHFEVQRN
jgi:hypothetical protein